MSADPAENLDLLDAPLRRVLDQVCGLIRDAGGRAWLVGGSVRDLALGRAVHDLDIEVFGVAPERLQDCLAADFELDLVGASFGILKLRRWPVDVGLPRREAKIGLGHKGFAVHSDPHLDLPTAAARRDFTINAVYCDPLNGEVADPWHGLADLERRLLRHTSPAFGEDPLRVLRAMQLTARFELTVVPDTTALCRTIAPEGLAGERIWAEWVKLLTLGGRPALGLHFLHECGWLAHFPELDALRGCPQDPVHHPEGDAWVHTLHCLDAFADERKDEAWEDLVVGCAVLCHDLGKATTTLTDADGRLRSLGHEEESVALTETFLGRMTNNRKLLAEVTPLVAEHMRPGQLFQAQASAAAVRRLAGRVGRIDRLVRVARADMFGRPPLPADTFPAGDWLLAQARKLDVLRAPPEPLVRGRHLIALGAVPGPEFKDVLDRVYEAQLAGKITTNEQGVALALKVLRKKRT
jgi:tRNA nucleotidyltransferase (CCA-adding enzyme)